MDAKLISKLDGLEARFDELTAQLSDPSVMGDGGRYQKTARAQSELSESVEKYRQWKKMDEELRGARAMLEDVDPEVRSLAQEELPGLESGLGTLEQEIKTLLIPKDPNDQKNVVLEIRAGTGGDEA